MKGVPVALHYVKGRWRPKATLEHCGGDLLRLRIDFLDNPEGWVEIVLNTHEIDMLTMAEPGHQ